MYKNNNKITTSYGIININISKESKYYNTISNIIDNILKLDNNIIFLYINPDNINNDEYNNIKIDLKKNLNFLIIQRRHSIEYNEFIKGNYDLNIEHSYKKLLSYMTKEEIEYIKTHTFDEI